MFSPCVFQDESLISRRVGTTTNGDSGLGGVSSTSHMASLLDGEEEVWSIVLNTHRLSDTGREN